MSKNTVHKIKIGYIDEEYGHMYCLDHGQGKSMIAVYSGDETGNCSVCGRLIDDPRENNSD